MCWGIYCKETKKILEVPITIGIGHSCQDLGEISGSYKAAVDALGYKAIVGAGSTIYINDVEPVSGASWPLTARTRQSLLQPLSSAPREKIEDAAGSHG